MKPEGPEVLWPSRRSSSPLWKPEFKKLRPVWQTVPSYLLRYLCDPAWFWMLLGTYEDEPIVFERWQIADLHDYSRIRVREKAPQIGASWLRACEAVWEAVVYEDSTTAFVSINQREAQEKVLYARKLYDGLPEPIRRWVPLVTDSVEQLAWGSVARPSRVMSLPSTSSLRGRRMNVVGDELDFFKDGGKETQRISIGRIARGGRVTLQSTCWGAGTVIDNLMQGMDEAGERQDDPVSRARYPWAVAERDDVLATVELARETLDEADFLEEYECVRGSMGSDPFPAELLRQQTHEEEPADLEKSKIMLPPGFEYVMGYDVGKGSGRHPSIASVLEKGSDGIWRQVAIHQPMSGFRPLTLPEQHDWLREMLHRVPTLKVCPDAQGIGAHIAEALTKEFGPRRIVNMIPGSKPQDLPSQVKEEMVTEAKRALENGEWELMPDRVQFQQFRRTKRDPAGRINQPGTRKKTHYDRFWAAIYAWYGVQAMKARTSPYSDHGLIVVDMGARRGVA